jgi:hypothetical protein
LLQFQPTPNSDARTYADTDSGLADSFTQRDGILYFETLPLQQQGQPILVRKDCDVRDCLNDPKTVVGVMPDGGVAP